MSTATSYGVVFSKVVEMNAYESPFSFKGWDEELVRLFTLREPLDWRLSEKRGFVSADLLSDLSCR